MVTRLSAGLNRSDLFWSLLLAAAYVAAAKLGFLFASISNNVSLIWLPSGIALGAMIIYGKKIAPGILLGATGANLLAGMSLLPSLGIACGNTLEAFIGLFILQKMGKSATNIVTTTNGILTLYMVAFIAPLITAASGALIVGTAHMDAALGETFLVWLLGDSMGIMLLTPLMLAYASRSYPLQTHEAGTRHTTLFLIILLGALITFGGLPEMAHELGHRFRLLNPHTESDLSGLASQYPLSFISLAALVVVALRANLLITSLSTLILVGCAITGTHLGYGPFVRDSSGEAMLLISTFALTCIMMAYTISVSVTERRILQQELLATDERFHLVLAGTEDGVWDWNTLTNECWFSPSFHTMLGYAPGEIPGYYHEWEQRLHPDDKHRTLQALYQHKRGLSDHYRAEYRLRRKDGSYIWILARGKGLFGNGGSAYRMVGTQINMTRRKELEMQLQLAGNVLKFTPEGIMITDPQLNIISVNPSFERTSGYSEQEVVGRNPSLLSSGRHDDSFYRGMWESIDELGYWQGEIWNRRKNGEIYPEWLSICAITSEDGELINYVGIFSDISLHSHMQKELHRLLYYDPLTMLPNRELFADRLAQALSQARHDGQMVGLLFLDLDRFKNINDTLGHASGDALLVEVSRRLKKHVPEDGTIARMGGDEFAIILPEITQAMSAAHVSEMILSDFSSSTFTLAGIALQVNCSIGISLFPVDGDSTELMVKHADTAMYRAKEGGGNNFQFFETAMSERFHESLELEACLRHALVNNELFIMYQPQISLVTNQIIGVEALARWDHPGKGLIPPGVFIPIAEASGQIGQIGEWLMKQAMKDTAEWIRQGHRELSIAINMSSVQFRQPDLVTVIDDAITASGIPYRNVELEITESLLMENTGAAMGILSQLNHMGLQISIDDFGTGYSSLSYLSQFAIHKLKIDQSFVRNMLIDKNNEEITATIIAMGHNLGLRVIAEGVEEQEQLEALREKGCDEIQGYLFSRPVVPEEITAMLKRTNKALHIVDRQQRKGDN